MTKPNDSSNSNKTSKQMKTTNEEANEKNNEHNKNEIKQSLPFPPFALFRLSYRYDCHLLIYFCFLILTVLLTFNSRSLVLYIIAFKYSIFNLPLHLELHMFSSQKWHYVE